MSNFWSTGFDDSLLFGIADIAIRGSIHGGVKRVQYSTGEGGLAGTVIEALQNQIHSGL